MTDPTDQAALDRRTALVRKAANLRLNAMAQRAIVVELQGHAHYVQQELLASVDRTLASHREFMRTRDQLDDIAVAKAYIATAEERRRLISLVLEEVRERIRMADEQASTNGRAAEQMLKAIEIELQPYGVENAF